MILVIPLRAKDGMPRRHHPAGAQGVAVADVIRRVAAKSHLAPEVSAMFQPITSA